MTRMPKFFCCVTKFYANILFGDSSEEEEDIIGYYD
jgi:hypothetical protein